MKRSRFGTFASALTCVGVLALAPSITLAQNPSSPPPPTKQPQLPSTKPVDPTPATPSRGKTREAKPETSSTAEGSGAANVSAADAAFATEAAEGGLLEVELGRMAVQKATLDAVKQFGQRMIDDHTKANEELKTVADAKQIALPDEARVKAKHRVLIAKLEKLSGPAFDKAYMADMVEDHVKDVAAFEREASSGKDADIQAFARKTLPTLKEHLTLAREAAKKANAKGTN